MVTWGQNQVFTFGGTPAAPSPVGTTAAGTAAAPAAPFSFGTPSSAPSTGFGSTPAPAPVAGSLFGTGTPASSPAPPGGLFGTSAPAAAPTGGLFGASTPAPAPPGSFFGTSTPAPAAGGLFGSQAPAPSGGGLFGAPAPSRSLFGSTTASTGGLFGAPAPAAGFGTQAAGPQIPAQAAMQAHMDASARQEAAKLQVALEKLYAAYTGAPTADKHKFVSTFYDDISPQQQQLQHAMGGRPVPPPKPPHVSDEDWLRAVVQNPDPNLYMPIALVGADALQTRLARAQDRANGLSKGIERLYESHTTLANDCARVQYDIQSLARAHTTLRTSLLQVMNKVELARNMNHVRQADEAILEQRLYQALKQVDQINKLLAIAQAKAKARSSMSRSMSIVNVPDKRELAPVLKGHRESLTSMIKVMEKDMRDMNLLKQHVAPKVRIPPR